MKNKLPWILLGLMLLIAAAPPTYFMPERQSGHAMLYSHREALILGFVPEAQDGTNFGYNLDIDLAAEEMLSSQGGQYTVPTGAETLSIVSSSAADAAGGTGATNLRVVCLDEDYEEVIFFVVPTGTTPVVTTQTCRAVNTTAVVGAGSGETNAGDITITQSTSGLTLRQIPAGDSLTQSCLYTVPKGKKYLINKLKFSVIKVVGGGQPEVQFYSNVYIPATGVRYRSMRLFIDANNVNNDSTAHIFTNTLSEKSTVWFTATTDQNNTQASCRIWYTLIDA